MPNIDVNGQTIDYPDIGDPNWGDNATNFAIQTSAALGKIGLSSGTSVDITQTLDVTGNTTLDANLSVGGNTTLTGNLTVNGNTQLGNSNTDTIGVTGIVNVDSGVLYVDPVNNRVGINDTTPSEALDINGNALISGTLGVTGTTSLSNTLGVIGDVSVNTNKFNITASSGNTSIAGTLGVTGDVAINTNKFNVVASSGNTSIAGTLGVTGIETITNTTDASSSTNGALIVSGGVGIAKKLYVGTDLSVGGSFTVTGGINPPYWNIVDQKASGTAAGTFAGGGWRTRDLNTTIGSNTITGSSLSSNQFTLPAGTYRIFASAPTYAVNSHKAKLRNITDSTDTLIGTSERSDQTYNGATRSFVSGTFTIASQKTFELQHRCSSDQNFGYASSFSVNEIYSTVELWKLA
jgi:hypothetical protein